jgi:hypothetical protein
LVASPRPGAQPFTFSPADDEPPHLSYGSVTCADADLDGRFKLLAAGSTASQPPFRPSTSLLFGIYKRPFTRGDGSAGVRLASTHRIELSALWHAASARNDFDQDGLPDFAFALNPSPGSTGTPARARLSSWK